MFRIEKTTGTRAHSDLVADAYDAHAARLRRQLRAAGASAGTAEDIVHEAFARALRAEPFDDRAHCLRWLQVVTRNLLTDHRRAAASRYAAVPGDVRSWASPDEDPSDTVIRLDEASRVHETLRTLPNRDTRLLWARDAMGQPVADVAAQSHLTHGSAHTLLSQARHRFAQAWDDGRAAVAVPVLRVLSRIRGWDVTMEKLALVAMAPFVLSIALVTGESIHSAGLPDDALAPVIGARHEPTNGLFATSRPASLPRGNEEAGGSARNAAAPPTSDDSDPIAPPIVDGVSVDRNPPTREESDVVVLVCNPVTGDYVTEIRKTGVGGQAGQVSTCEEPA